MKKLAFLIFTLFVLTGCGIAWTQANKKLLESTDIGTPKEDFYYKLQSDFKAKDCQEIGSDLEACPCFIEISDLNNYVYFYKGRYVGTGHQNDFLDKFFNELELTSGHNNSYILFSTINAPMPVAFFKEKSPIEVYVNAGKIGETKFLKKSLFWEQKQGKVKLEILQDGKLLNQVSWEIAPNKKYKLSHNYSTGIISLDGDNSSQIKITSEPPGAKIYAGSSANALSAIGDTTPSTVTRSAVTKTWKAEYYQVYLEGYKKSSVVFRDNSFGNRIVHFELQKSEPKPKPTIVEPEPESTIAEPEPEPTIAESKPREIKSTGSGFFINEMAYLLTNYHVVDECTELETVILGRSIPLYVIGVDPKNDLAILKADNPVKNHAYFREGRGVKAGEDIAVVGYPLSGLLSSGPTVTFGNVNSLRGLLDDASQIQIQAPIQPGNSGGPLLDDRGLVVGVVVSSLSDTYLLKNAGTVPQNINFAINGLFVRTFLDAHNINYKLAPKGNQLSKPAIAEKAVSFVTPIICY